MRLDEWRYMQLALFIKRLPLPLRPREEYTSIEKLCITDSSKGNISKIYRSLFKRDELEIPKYILKWERELDAPRGKTSVTRIIKMTHTSATDVRTAEMNLKCLKGWYATPDKTSNYREGQSADCWRGCAVRGTMAHLWWDCPIIKNYWKKILPLIKVIIKKEIIEDPWVVLFQGGEESIKEYKRSLTPHLLNAAKRLIPKKWREAESPQVWEWLESVEDTYRREEWKDGADEENADYRGKWANWFEFKKTRGYMESLRET